MTDYVEPDVFRTCCESPTFLPHQPWCVAYMPPPYTETADERRERKETTK